MDDEIEEIKKEYHAFRTALGLWRADRTSYFEKLALLDAGTVALVVTAVLGPLHAQIKHRILLGSGLSILVLAMLILLIRNFMANVELRHHILITFDFDVDPESLSNRRKFLIYTESAGLALTAIGMVVLLVNVWFVI